MQCQKKWKCVYNLFNDTFSTGVELEYEHERQVEKDVEYSSRGRLKHYINKKNCISSSPVAMWKNQHSMSLGQVANPDLQNTATETRHQEILKGRLECWTEKHFEWRGSNGTLPAWRQCRKLRKVWSHVLRLQPTRCKFLSLFIPVRCSACFRRFFRPSLGARSSTYSVRHLSDRYCNVLLAWTASSTLQ